MCAIEIIYKYNLTESVKKTQEIVVDFDWIHALKTSKNETQVRQQVAKAIDPLSKHMMNAPGPALVNTMPDEVVNWIAETAIVWAQHEGIRDNETEWFFQEPEECPEPEVIETVVEVPVYLEGECPPCPEPEACDPCPIVDCPIPEPCPTPFCDELKCEECEECLCEEYCES